MKARYVYFIKPVGMQGPIKIGCSHIPLDRLQALSFWSPFELEIVGHVEGSFKDEIYLHNCFAKDHLHHEWFSYTEELWQIVQKVLVGGSVDCVRGDISPIGTIRRIGRKEIPADRRNYIKYSHRVRWARNKMRDAGEKHDTPAFFQNIMNKWNGWLYRHIQGVTPTEDEFARMDAYLLECTLRAAALKSNQRIAA